MGDITRFNNLRHIDEDGLEYWILGELFPRDEPRESTRRAHQAIELLLSLSQIGPAAFSHIDGNRYRNRYRLTRLGAWTVLGADPNQNSKMVDDYFRIQMEDAELCFKPVSDSKTMTSITVDPRRGFISFEDMIHQEEDTSPFDQISRTRPDGSAYWSARDLMSLMGYRKWERFEDVISRAIRAAQNTNTYSDLEFSRVREATTRGNRGGGQEKNDYELSRHAAYLVAMNGDPSKLEVARAQAYFAEQTRKAELTQETVTTPAVAASGEDYLALATNFLAAANKLVATERQLTVAKARNAELEVVNDDLSYVVAKSLSVNGWHNPRHIAKVHHFWKLGYEATPKERYGRRLGPVMLLKAIATELGHRKILMYRPVGHPDQYMPYATWATPGLIKYMAWSWRPDLGEGVYDPKGSSVRVPWFTDEALTRLIRVMREEGFMLVGADHPLTPELYYSEFPERRRQL